MKPPHWRQLGLAAAVLGVFAAAGTEAERLPGDVMPHHYELRLTVDPAARSFTGSERIDIRLKTPGSSIVLDAADLTLTQVEARQNGTSQRGSVSIDATAETATLRFDRPLAAGNAELLIDYTGPIRTDLRGLYLSEAAGRRYAVTQFEPTDARRMFPAFDEPDKKATFALTVVVPTELMAISNGPEVRETPGPGADRKTITFGTTPPMSTYLVALAVGKFACRTQDAGVPLRVCSIPESFALTRFSLDQAAELLAYYNLYFAIDYPFAKLDLVAIPDFAAGAMENTGAIFFRESLLLIDPAHASRQTRARVATVIAHEMAHQWFGDLVTMRWWDDLWLNEGFATWMETKAVDALHPAWHVDLDAIRERQSAMRVDVLAGTRPIKLSAQTPDEINQLFDPIAYGKGGAVLGMIEAYLGREPFRTGINAYLSQYKYANATSEDFWRSMTTTTGKPVDRILASYVTHPGIPLISVEAACQQGQERVSLTQTRLREPSSNNASEPAPLWTIPISLRQPSATAGSQQWELFDARHQTVHLDRCASWIYANANQRGYYRTTYGDQVLPGLMQHVSNLSASERLGLSLDLWSDVRRQAHDVGTYLTLAHALATDAAATIVATTTSRVRWIGEYLTTPDSTPLFEGWIRHTYEGSLALPSRAAESDEERVQRRAAVLQTLAIAGRDEAVIADARSKIESYLAHPGAVHVEPALLDEYVSLAARGGGRELYEKYVHAANAATTPVERYRFLYALADFDDAALAQRTIEYALTDAVRSQDAALVIAAVFDHPIGREIAWPIVERRWVDIDRKVGGFAGTGRIIEALGAYCDRQHAANIHAFFTTHPVPEATRSLALALQQIDSCAALRDQQAPRLNQWLEQQVEMPSGHTGVVHPPPSAHKERGEPTKR